MLQGARRILDCEGIIISFNGKVYDVPQLASLAGIDASETLPFIGTHFDMLEEASRERWPPNPGTAPILGCCLRDHYEHYFDQVPLAPPSWLGDYEQNNWQDCYMAAALWRKISPEHAGGI